MKVLITGGAGFIGSWVVDAYLKLGWEVVVVDNLKGGRWENLNPSAKFYLLDIREKEIKRVFEKERFELVNHHAAQINVRKSVEDPFEDAGTNILGTLNLLENCLNYRVKKFIFSSSGGAIYGEPEKFPVKENHPKRPLSPYGISKHMVEHYLYYFRCNFGLNYLILRYGNVYGPRQDPQGEAGVVSIFISQMLQGKTPTIFGDGEQVRDYVYVEDVVRANLLATHKIEKLNQREIDSPDTLTYNIGTGRGTSVNQLYRLLSKLLDFPQNPLYLPPRPGDLKKVWLDVSRAEKELDWKPEVSLKEGLLKTVRWFKKNDSPQG